MSRILLADVATAAALLGRLGGRSTSPAKVAASRANGRLGGRPRNDSNARSASKAASAKRHSKK